MCFWQARPFPKQHLIVRNAEATRVQRVDDVVAVLFPKSWTGLPTRGTNCWAARWVTFFVAHYYAKPQWWTLLAVPTITIIIEPSYNVVLDPC